MQKFSGAGAFLGKWGGAFGTAVGQFMGPQALSVDAAGDVYVVDRSNNRIQAFGATCTANLVISNQTLAGAQHRQASTTATFGPNLNVNGTNVIVNAPTVAFGDSVQLGGTFAAGNTTTC